MQERLGLGDRAVDVRLGGEVHDRVDAAGRVDGGVHGLAIADVAAHERVARVILDGLQVVGIARVRELVEAHDLELRIAREHPPHEVRADEPRPAADEQPHPFFTPQS